MGAVMNYNIMVIYYTWVSVSCLRLFISSPCEKVISKRPLGYISERCSSDNLWRLGAFEIEYAWNMPEGQGLGNCDL